MPPAAPKIFHITHVENLRTISENGCLWSDAECLRRGLVHQTVGMSEIKRLRLEELVVKCHPETRVGDYVPFYFCPRSIMLYVLHMANHPGLTYRGGQRPIVHLQLDVRDTVAWADANGLPWAFSDRNAGSDYAAFFCDLRRLDRVNWRAVAATDFRDPVIKDGKQAEFLVRTRVPWSLVEGIGVVDSEMAQHARDALGGATHRPEIRVQRSWYY